MYKEYPQPDTDFKIPAGIHPTEGQYKRLYQAYCALLGMYDRAGAGIDSLDQMLTTESKMRLKFQAEHKRLIDMHRTLPPGCFKIPDRRPPPLRVGDKGNPREKPLSPVDD